MDGSIQCPFKEGDVLMLTEPDTRCPAVTLEAGDIVLFRRPSSCYRQSAQCFFDEEAAAIADRTNGEGGWSLAIETHKLRKIGTL